MRATSGSVLLPIAALLCVGVAVGAFVAPMPFLRAEAPEVAPPPVRGDDRKTLSEEELRQSYLFQPADWSELSDGLAAVRTTPPQQLAEQTEEPEEPEPEPTDEGTVMPSPAWLERLDWAYIGWVREPLAGGGTRMVAFISSERDAWQRAVAEGQSVRDALGPGTPPVRVLEVTPARVVLEYEGQRGELERRERPEGEGPASEVAA